ncbi:uncharacterized protein C9orf85 homolog isoform X1 [Eschrichtius robustus]|uniref:uncharacterized protein C9orf85 homolog isoform X1 n=1 Tax=Eschrichtius robustus TaxID=9764 RepID=UPI0035C035D4
MSSQKGNVARSRPQRHQNTFSFKNDKFDKSVQTKILEPAMCSCLKPRFCQKHLTLSSFLRFIPESCLSQQHLIKECVKCLQKTVKDSYHIMCRPCACDLEVCAKCGKREDVVIPFNKEPEKTENVENNLRSSHRRRRNEESDDDLDFDIDLEDTEEDNQMD